MIWRHRSGSVLAQVTILYNAFGNCNLKYIASRKGQWVKYQRGPIRPTSAMEMKNKHAFTSPINSQQLVEMVRDRSPHIVNTCWRHQMETFSALLAICAGNSPVPGESHTQRPVTRSFDVFLDLRLNKRLSKQSWGWWFETPSCPSWRHGNDHGCWWVDNPRNQCISSDIDNVVQPKHSSFSAKWVIPHRLTTVIITTDTYIQWRVARFNTASWSEHLGFV